MPPSFLVRLPSLSALFQGLVILSSRVSSYGVAAPSRGVGVACRSVDLITLNQYVRVQLRVPLCGGDKTDSAMAVLVVVPLNEASYPFPCSTDMGEAVRGITGTIFARAEQRLRVRVIVANPWPTERGGDA